MNGFKPLLDKAVEILNRKPLLFSASSAVYLIAAVFLKWYIRPPMAAAWFLAGGAIGIYFLDFAEAFFNLNPSPFRSIVFAALFSVVSFFVVTSSGSFVGSGLVLSLYLSLIMWQLGEWRLKGNLNTWYTMVAGPVTIRAQQWGMVLFIVVFCIETFLFIR